MLEMGGGSIDACGAEVAEGTRASGNGCIRSSAEVVSIVICTVGFVTCRRL